MIGKTIKITIIAGVLALVLIAGIYHFHSVPGKDTLPISVSDATTDVTQKYDAIDFGITPTVKKYKNAVFDIEKIKNTIEKEGVLDIRIDGRDKRIPLEKYESLSGRANPDLVFYTGLDDRKIDEHVSIGNKSFILWIRMDGIDYFIDTTTLEDEEGRLVHSVYTSKDVGWSKEHGGLSGCTLTPQYLGDTTPKIDRDIYEFSEEDFSKFPVVGRFLKYGAGNLELTNKEAGDIRNNFSGRVVHYNNHYYDLDFIIA